MRRDEYADIILTLRFLVTTDVFISKFCEKGIANKQI